MVCSLSYTFVCPFCRTSNSAVPLIRTLSWYMLFIASFVNSTRIICSSPDVVETGFSVLPGCVILFHSFCSNPFRWQSYRMHPKKSTDNANKSHSRRFVFCFFFWFPFLPRTCRFLPAICLLLCSIPSLWYSVLVFIKYIPEASVLWKLPLPR